MTRTFAAVLVAVTAASRPATATADVVTDWNAIMVATVASQNPFAQARIAATVQLAVFEAVNAISREYTPYRFQLEPPPGASAEAAAVAAAHDVLVHYLPAAAAALATARATSLAGIPDGEHKDAGVGVGSAAAAAMIALRANDGSAPPQFHVPALSEAGEWQPTAACPAAGGILRHWGRVAPFGVRSITRFRSAPPPPVASARYARAYHEVLTVGAADSVRRPADRADVARFYNVNLAVRVWNDVARQLAAVRPLALTAGARAFALLNMAISDGLVASMDTKYRYRFWRPETAIRAGDDDDNERTAGNPAFTPFITTPCFPGYPSAHASGSYAARAVVARIWGSGNHTIVLTHPAVPEAVLTYRTLKAITDDIDDARVYGGIHFRFDQTAGAVQGSRIGRTVYLTRLRPTGK
jgi:hypothetical protein